MLTPKWRGVPRAAARRAEWTAARAILLGLVALVFWVGVFGIAYRVLATSAAWRTSAI